MTEIVKRTISGFVYVSVIIGTTIYSPLLFSVLFFILLLIAAQEFAKLQSIHSYLLVIPAIILYLLFPFIGNATFYFYEIAGVCSVLTILFLLHFLFNKKTFEFSKPVNFILYIGYVLFPFLILINLQSSSKELILCSFLLIWFNDTFAYLSGMKFGKHKLFPSVSPKKTIEGFIGGGIMTIIAAVALHYLIFNSLFNPYYWVVFALIITTFGSLGDLVQSKLKRIAGVKDSGNFMPGHGGVLDRLDSVIFVVPILFLFIKIIEYVS